MGVLTNPLFSPRHAVNDGFPNGSHRVFKTFSSNLEMQ